MKDTKQRGGIRRRRRYGLVTGSMLLMIILFFALGNLVFTILDERIDMDIDMTTQKMYSLSSEAKNYVSTLTQDIVFTILQDESDFDSRTIEAIHNYAAASAHITYRYVDIDLNPSFAAQFPGQKLTNSSIIIQCGEKYQIFDETDLYYLGESGYYTSIQGIKIDQKLCSAIAAVTETEKLIVYVTTGHAEAEMSELTALCESSGRRVEQIDLMTQSLEDAGDTLIIYEPVRDFEPEEIRKIEDFLMLGNKNLLLLMDAQVGKLQTLEDFLLEWGITLDNNVVLDQDSYWGNSPLYLLADVDAQGEIGSLVREEKLNIVMPLSRSLQLQKSPVETYQTFPILYSADTAYAKDMDGGVNELEPTADDEHGRKTLAAGSTTTLVRENETVNSTVIVFGSAAVAANSLMTSASLGNRDVLLDALTYGKQKLEIMSLRPIYIRDMSLSMTANQIRAWRIALVYVLPLVLCAVGFFVWIRRKRR